MRRSLLPALAAAAVVTTGVVWMAGGLAQASPAQSSATPKLVHACGVPSAGKAACLALRRTTDHVSAASLRSRPNAAPSGLGASDIQSAYALPSSTGGKGQTVAIVDAYDDPTAEADLATYRSQFGLSACTTANGCFQKVNQNGVAGSYPRKNGGWAEEISLDLDMVSATCPNCNIVLVEAKTSSFANLGAAENTAASMADVVSNSYGGSDASDSTYGKYYNHPGIAITVSSGDAGYGVEYPASSQYVTAVGGTSLKTASNSRGWSETAWSDAGSGCSSYNTAPSGQADADTGCSKRAVADVSAVADPNTGVAVYDSTAYLGQSGWMVFGGTSVAAPLVAGVYGLAGNASSVDNNYPYSHSSSLNDVTSGSNGTCTTSQWCKARAGWDGPTGLGTPNGVGAF
jgi:hypothetical protein